MIRIMMLLIVVAFSDACVDRLNVNLGKDSLGVLVVDGMITDQPGPYEVRLYRVAHPDDNLKEVKPILAKQVSILDDTGESETLTIGNEFVYRTDPKGIRGVVGRKYKVHIELLDGSVFESRPDELLPVGAIDSVYYLWESHQPIAQPTQYGFRVFLNGTNSGTDKYVRWRFSGTYVVESFPHLNKYEPNCSDEPPPITPDPLPCSGYITTGQRSRAGLTIGDLVRVGECTCCICWVSNFERKPNLNSDLINTAGSYSEIEVGYIPFNEWTFGKGKYMAKVEQMSLSREAFEFWKILKDQKEGTSSLFQPSLGKAKTNIFPINTDKDVMGIFYASAITKKILFLTAANAKVPVPPYSIEPAEDNCALWRSCKDIFGNASTSPPPEWR